MKQARQQHAGERAFTLIELLVVIAIIAILAAILFPVFAQAREQARGSVSLSNFRQVGLAIRMYTSDYDETMPRFNEYNFVNTSGKVIPITDSTHIGIADDLQPYVKNHPIFHDPDDTQAGTQITTAPGASQLAGAHSEYDYMGSSIRFHESDFSVIAWNPPSLPSSSSGGPMSSAFNWGGFTGKIGSVQFNAPLPDYITDPTGGTPLTKDQIVTDAMFLYPANTNIGRDEIFPWFSPQVDSGPPIGLKYGYASTDPAIAEYTPWHPTGGTVVFADGHVKFIVSEGAFDNLPASPSGQTYNTGCWWGCD
jgi:prepilin-type N-terminal cleavage/methylation domain-containing protein/prepilin-type processing-associated H-X9-DG protein